MDDGTLRHLLDALEAARQEADAAVWFIGPGRRPAEIRNATETARKHLAHMSALLIAAREEERLKRRDLLKVIGVLAISPAAVERIAATARRPSAVDVGLIDAYAEVIHVHAQAVYRAPPASLEPAVEYVLNQLVEAQGASATPDLRARVNQLTSEVSSFAGWLAYDLGRTGAARSHFALAANAAREAEDRTLWALAIASDGITRSPAADGSLGDPRRSSVLLGRAAEMLPGHAPSRAQAYVHAYAAARAAGVGEVDELHRHLDFAQSALEEPTDEEGEGFWIGWHALVNDVGYLDDFLGAGLNRLDHDDAETVLSGIVTRTSQPRRRANAQRYLTEVHVRRRNYDAAAQAGLGSLAAAQEGGLERHVESLRGVLVHVPAAVPELTELKEALGRG